MGGDGLLGNSFFFFLSGFGVAMGAKSRGRGFFPWYWRRIGRIYPTAILGVILLQIPLYGVWGTHSFWDYVHVFIWPTPYAYVGTIMVVYIAIYWLLKLKSRAMVAVCIAAIACEAWVMFAHDVATVRPGVRLILWNLPGMHTLYFCCVALLGATVAPITYRPVKTLPRDILAFLAIFGVYMGVKFETDRGHIPQTVLMVHAMVAVMCLLMMRISGSDGFHALCRRIKPVGSLVAFLAPLTLAIYVVQGYVWSAKSVMYLPRPLNLAVFWSLTFCGAVVLDQLAKPFTITRSRNAS